jgi:hypothetical protein
MKRRFICSIPLAFVLFVLLSGCCLDPKKVYPGPELPKGDLVFITQIDDLLYHPIYMLTGKSGHEEVRIDDLGVAVLPGTYKFKAKLYHSRLQESQRIATMPIVPGESDFPVQQPVLSWVRTDEPYKETENTEFTVNAGFKYGLWCPDDEQLKMKVLGPYR